LTVAVVAGTLPAKNIMNRATIAVAWVAFM